MGPLTASVKTNVTSDYHQFSQEIRIVSDLEGPLSWLAGGNFYSDELTAFQNFTLNAFGPGGLSGFFPVEEGISSLLNQKAESFAIFGEASYELIDGLTVAGGVRWTRYKRTATTNAYIFDATGLGLAFVEETEAFSRLLVETIPEISVARSWSKWSGRVNLSYEFLPSWFAYGGVSRGFKGGDFNGGALFSSLEATLADPEFVTSYEIGLKGQSGDGRYGFDISGFYYDFTNQQVAVLIPGSNATLQSLSNAAKTQVTGFEAAATAMPMDNLFLEAKIGVLDAEFKRFQLDAGDPSTDFAGNRTASSPKFSFVGAGQYSAPLRIGKLGLAADISYTGSHYFTADNNPALYEDGYWLANGSLFFEDSNNRYKISIWSKNLTNESYFISGLGNAGLGFLELFPGPPRTFGLTVTGRF